MLLRNSFLKQLSVATLSSLLLAVTISAALPPQPWPEKPFEPLSDARIAALPEAEQAPWREYLEKSRKIAASLPKRVAEVSPATAPQKSTGARLSRGLKTDAARETYATEEARTLADRVVVWQSAAGGWTKGIDYQADPAAGKNPNDSWSAGTFDNNATIVEMRYLARVIGAATPDDTRAQNWRAAFLRGLQYVFNAQYPNGGYPQIYPLVGGYHDGITYNDNAMARVLELLADVAAGNGDFSFVPEAQRGEAGRRFALGIACILKTQIVEPSGRRTVWCQQHDMLTLRPCAARNFEPAAASTSETTALLRLLMRRVEPTPEVRAALADAVAWLEKVAMRDTIWDRSTMPSKLVPTPGAPLLWARMYEIGTDRPVFGDRDQLVHYDVGELSPERQKGYQWFAEWPANTVAAYKKWLAELNTPPKPKKK